MRLSDLSSDQKEALTRLLDQIAEEAKQTARWTGLPIFDDLVMGALRRVPRHCFVSSRDHSLAYMNRPLGIGSGQTISQPYIVALMTALLELRPGHRVLEIGTGCGYQTAVLAELADHVYSIEVLSVLAGKAKKTLNNLGYNNIEFRVGNGRNGWKKYSPFQSIMVTAVSQDIPGILIDQLDRGGRMVIPQGSIDGSQSLVLVTKGKGGVVKERDLLPVSFVPLV